MFTRYFPSPKLLRLYSLCCDCLTALCLTQTKEEGKRKSVTKRKCLHDQAVAIAVMVTTLHTIVKRRSTTSVQSIGSSSLAGGTTPRLQATSNAKAGKRPPGNIPLLLAIHSFLICLCHVLSLLCSISTNIQTTIIKGRKKEERARSIAIAIRIHSFIAFIDSLLRRHCSLL
jgi:hypothetical protein